VGGVDPLELGFEFNKLSRFDDELVLLKNGIMAHQGYCVYKKSRLGCQKKYL